MSDEQIGQEHLPSAVDFNQAIGLVMELVRNYAEQYQNDDGFGHEPEPYTIDLGENYEGENVKLRNYAGILTLLVDDVPMREVGEEDTHHMMLEVLYFIISLAKQLEDFEADHINEVLATTIYEPADVEGDEGDDEDDEEEGQKDE